VKRTRTEITIEVEEVIQGSSQSRRLPQEWCPACGTQAVLVSPEQAAAIAGVSVRKINRWVETGIIHFLETNDGLLLVCVHSLGQIPEMRK
jgi:hypothetical protein